MNLEQINYLKKIRKWLIAAFIMLALTLFSFFTFISSWLFATIANYSNVALDVFIAAMMFSTLCSITSIFVNLRIKKDYLKLFQLLDVNQDTQVQFLKNKRLLSRNAILFTKINKVLESSQS